MIFRPDRVSIDLDTKNQVKLLSTYFNMKWLMHYIRDDKTNNGYMEEKETNKGYHIKGYFKYRGPEQNLHIRRMLGDCKNRLEMDERRLKAGLDECIETLFTYKKVNGVVSRETDYNIMSEQFWGFRVG